MAISRAELRRLIADFEALPAEMRREIRPALRRAGAIVQREAQRRAGFSTQIPPHIKVSTQASGGGTGISVLLSPDAPPHARLYEGPEDWWHPVYGNRRRWVKQRARPYFDPAITAKTDEVVEVFDDAIARAFASRGF